MLIRSGKFLCLLFCALSFAMPASAQQLVDKEFNRSGVSFGSITKAEGSATFPNDSRWNADAACGAAAADAAGECSALEGQDPDDPCVFYYDCDLVSAYTDLDGNITEIPWTCSHNVKGDSVTTDYNGHCHCEGIVYDDCNSNG